jgi:hypothetical protein
VPALLTMAGHFSCGLNEDGPDALPYVRLATIPDRLTLRVVLKRGLDSSSWDADSGYSAFQRMAAVMRVRPLG